MALTAWVEQRKCAKALDVVGIYSEHLSDESDHHHGTIILPKLFKLDQKVPITGFCPLTQNIELNFVETKQSDIPPKHDKIWTPIDSAKRDALQNPEFLEEILQFEKTQSALFWKCPETYVLHANNWNEPRNCILAMEKLVSNLPFLALMPSHPASPANTQETIVFYQLADRFCFGPGVRYTTLSVLVNWFMVDSTLQKKPMIKKIARELVMFVHDHTRFLKNHASIETEHAAEKVELLTGGSILRMFSLLEKPKVSVEWLNGIKFDNPRLQALALARKVLHSPQDFPILDWYESGVFTSRYLSAPKIANLEMRIIKASSIASYLPKKRKCVNGPSTIANPIKLTKMDILCIVANEILGTKPFALEN
jgi:hypothetical protein